MLSLQRSAYGLIVSGVALPIIVTVQALGTNLDPTFSTVSTELMQPQASSCHLYPRQQRRGFFRGVRPSQSMACHYI